jgi:hypothetical protein
MYVIENSGARGTAALNVGEAIQTRVYKVGATMRALLSAGNICNTSDLPVTVRLEWWETATGTIHNLTPQMTLQAREARQIDFMIGLKPNDEVLAVPDTADAITVILTYLEFDR